MQFPNLEYGTTTSATDNLPDLHGLFSSTLFSLSVLGMISASGFSMQSSSSGPDPYNTKVLTSATDVPNLLLQGFLKVVLVVVVIVVLGVVLGDVLLEVVVVLIVVLLVVIFSVVVVVVVSAVVELISLPLRLGPQQTFSVIFVFYI